MKQEPTCVRDMIWINRQKAGNSTCVQYEKGEEPNKGALCNTEIDVIPYSNDKIKVEQVKYYYDSPAQHGGWQLKEEFETLETLTFEEFRKSKWWDAYLQKVKTYNCDSSWMDDNNTLVDEYGCTAQFKVPQYKSVWWCSSDVPSGNVLPCEVCVSYDGTICVTVDNESVEFEASEVVEKLRKLEYLERAGVSLNDDGDVVVKVSNNDE